MNACQNGVGPAKWSEEGLAKKSETYLLLGIAQLLQFAPCELWGSNCVWCDHHGNFFPLHGDHQSKESLLVPCKLQQKNLNSAEFFFRCSMSAVAHPTMMSAITCKKV